MKYFISVIILVVAAAIIAGFFIVGSPSEERLRRFDQQRIEGLQIIQNEIINYWQAKGSLPQNLEALDDRLQDAIIPQDPETGQAYGYRAKGDLVFELCAKFKTPSRGGEGSPGLTTRIIPAPPGETKPYYFGLESWQHDAGNVCFERSIDPEDPDNIYKKPTSR